LATVMLNSGGIATFATSSLSAGTHILAATYSGASGFSPSGSASLSQVVTALASATATALTSSANPSNVGSSDVHRDSIQ
jgi:hypothetical protein